MNAYWISPYGKIIELGITHIDYILKNPEQFDLSLEQLKEVYAKYGEPVGLEGKAREEIISQVLKEGWLRLRETKQFWTVQGYGIDSSAFKSLHKWADALVLDRKLFMHDTVYIIDLKSDKTSDFTVEELIEGKSLRIGKKKSKFISYSGLTFLRGK